VFFFMGCFATPCGMALLPSFESESECVCVYASGIAPIVVVVVVVTAVGHERMFYALCVVMCFVMWLGAGARGQYL